MSKITIELPDEALAAPALISDEATREAKRVPAVHW
jgi:hypothetical protein